MQIPIELLYLGAVFLTAIIFFTVFKRPLHEGMMIAFIVLIAITGTWGRIGTYIFDALKEPSLYVIIVFVISANLLTKTSVIDDCIAIILSIFGRLRGGAGYVAIIGSTYMGSLSGSGPGNVATTGVFTIPAMKKTGFPPHLAANIEAQASTMGNMIPPAGMIAVAFATLDKLYPNTYTMSQFWMLLWGVALWFVVQRIITMYIMCRYYKVEAMKKEDIPSFKATIKKGWKAIFLPIIVFLPFLLTSVFEGFFVNRLGGGFKPFSDSILLFIPALIVLCGILLSDKETKQRMKPKYIYSQICKGMKGVVPTSALVLTAYFISNVFADINLETAIGEFFAEFNLPLVLLAFVLPLFTAILGMLIPGSTQVKIFGGMIISMMAAAGGNPMMAAAMLPCICGAMHGVTPPYCTCVYIAMGIAEADIKPTLKNCMIWVVIHYLLSVAMMLCLLPVLGLIV